MDSRISFHFIRATALKNNYVFALLACFATKNTCSALLDKQLRVLLLLVLQRHLAEHDHGLGPVARSQLAEYGRDVRLDGGLGHAEFITDLLV